MPVSSESERLGLGDHHSVLVALALQVALSDEVELVLRRHCQWHATHWQALLSTLRTYVQEIISLRLPLAVAGLSVNLKGCRTGVMG